MLKYDGITMLKHSHSGSSYSCHPSSSTPDIPTAQTSNGKLNIKFYDDRDDNDDGGSGGGKCCKYGILTKLCWKYDGDHDAIDDDNNNDGLIAKS